MQVSHTLANLKKIIVIVIFTMNSGQNTDNLMIKVMLSKEALAHLKRIIVVMNSDVGDDKSDAKQRIQRQTCRMKPRH